MQYLKGKHECFLCQDGAPFVERDLRSREYEEMARVHLRTPGIRTKGQYQRLLKSRGLTDDVTHKELVRCALDTSKRERVREAAIRGWTERLTPQLQQRQASWRR